MKLLSVLMAGAMAYGAEPDWRQIEKHSLEFLQQYVRIRSINPPADTSETAKLIQSELEKNGLTPKVYHSGPGGQTHLLLVLKGRDSSKKPLLLLNHMAFVPMAAKSWVI